MGKRNILGQLLSQQGKIPPLSVAAAKAQPVEIKADVTAEEERFRNSQADIETEIEPDTDNEGEKVHSFWQSFQKAE